MSNTASKTDSAVARIIVTAGEPAGIGPDLIALASRHEFNAELTVAADPAVLLERAKLIGVPLELDPYDPARAPQRHRSGRLKSIPLKCAAAVLPGRADNANAAQVLEAIRLATRACLRREFAAMVTAPVNKAVINDAGNPFSGHTEFIAGLCDDSFPVMLLMNSSLRVALVTTHIPLADVAGQITPDRLTRVIGTVHDALRARMGIDTPRLLVCGLNPHAGEGGYLGREEQQVIIPVLDELRSRGLRLRGPVPADSAFTRESLADIDAVIAMYHDQGLPVLKSRGFGESVNITLGLPIIRTSPDHGSALALAGTGQARPDSLIEAIHCAITMAAG